MANELFVDWKPRAAARTVVEQTGRERATSQGGAIGMNRTCKAAVAALIFAVGFAGSVAAGPLEDANAAFKKGHYATALRLASWYRKAAEKGDARAQYNLGLMYDNGLGVPQDYAAALRWYRKSAEQGDAKAQNEVGWEYELGAQVRQDYAEALRWYRKSANQGNAGGQYHLGDMYRFGNGVPVDYAEALKWFRKAANQGQATAQWRLGGMYYYGHGVPQNYVRAYMWWNLAGISATRPDDWAVAYRDDVAAKMTHAQIAEGQRMSEHCLQSKDCE
jgi:uncharacterized protein